MFFIEFLVYIAGVGDHFDVRKHREGIMIRVQPNIARGMINLDQEW